MFDQPNPLWCTIKLTVTAGRDREFVIAAGAVDVRSKRKGAKWTEVAALHDLLVVPITVEKNRVMEEWISGSSLAGRIQATLPGAAEVQVCFRLRDHHRAAIQSDPLVTTVSELM